MVQRYCPQCAEKVAAEALVCRHCGHRFTPDEVAEWQRRRGRSSLVSGVVAIVVLGGMAYACVAAVAPSGQADPARAVPCNVQAAGALVQAGIESGIVRRTTERGLIVDEDLFLAMDFDLKRRLAEARACQIGNGEMSETYVSIRSSRTDAIIASGIPGGGTFRVKD